MFQVSSTKSTSKIWGIKVEIPKGDQGLGLNIIQVSNSQDDRSWDHYDYKL